MFYLNNNKLTFQKIQTKTILDLLKKYDINKAPDRFLKDGADMLSIRITEICNISIKLSHFPKNCKLAKLKPLYKKGTKTDPKNFKPIWLLPIVSKIIKRVIKDQIMNYILFRHQSVFPKNYSTDNLFHIS